MSTDIDSESPINQLPESAGETARRTADEARETARRAADAAKGVTVATKGTARRATDTARDMYQSATLKAGDTLATSKEYVRRKPVPVVLGAIAFGAAIGYMLAMAWRKPTFGERYAEAPMVAMREAILGAIAPVSQRVHKGYDSARDGAGKAMGRVHRFGSERTCNSISDRFGRIGNNLKFW